MKGGRKNLQRAAMDKEVTLQDGQSIMQVVSLRGSNLIEVMDEQGNKLLALFPAKFQKTIWIKRGNFVVVDDSGKERALESGSKVACMVSQVLFYEQVRILQKSPDWPEVFKLSSSEDSDKKWLGQTSLEEKNDTNSSDDDGLAPLEANTNRIRPFELHENNESDAELDSDSDTDS